MAQIEPFADIIAEKRRRAQDIERMSSDSYARELVADIRREADRLEAAHKRELKEAEVNAAPLPCVVLKGVHAEKLREALINICNHADVIKMSDDDMLSGNAQEILRLAGDALAAPDRNCDVGDAVEQTERFRRYCDKYLLDRDEGECVGCPLVNMAGYCEFNWSQLPYESEVVK